MGSYTKKANEGFDNRNGSTIAEDNTQLLPRGQVKPSDYSVPKKGLTMMNLNVYLNDSISSRLESDLNSITSDSMSEASSSQSNNKVVNPCSHRNYVDTKCTASASQQTNNVTNLDITNMNTGGDNLLIDKSNKETFNNQH